MSHGIYQQRVIMRSKPAWHSLGTVYAEELVISASEAVKQVTGGVVINEKPLHFQNAAGLWVPCEDYKAIIREADADGTREAVLGVTTDKYVTIPYATLATALDPLSQKYKVESCGLINDGGLCFIAFRGPDFDIKGDVMQDYFIANLSQTPGQAHKVLAAPVRVVCRNTNLMAHDRASINLSVQHSAGAAQKIGFAADLVAAFKEATTKSRELFDQFAGVQITEQTLDRLLDAAWPMPSVPTELRLLQGVFASQEQGAVQQALGARWEKIVKAQESYDKAVSRINIIRNAGRDIFNSFEPAHLRGTLWAGYNSVTEVADWREGRGADVGSVWGGRAQEKTRAFSEAVAILQGK